MVDIISAEEKRLDLINRTDGILEKCLETINLNIKHSLTSSIHCWTGYHNTSKEIMETVNDILIAMLTLKGYEVLETRINTYCDSYGISIKIEVP